MATLRSIFLSGPIPPGRHFVTFITGCRSAGHPNPAGPYPDRAVDQTLHDTGPDNTQNCLLQTFIDGGACDEPEQGFPGPARRGWRFYPIQTNVPHLADGSTNLHVHGLIVSARPCHDEVVRSITYPANWGGSGDKAAALPGSSKRADLHLRHTG